MNLDFTFPDYTLIFISILNLIVCGFILRNEYRNKINIWFATFVLFMSFWPLTLFFYRNAPIHYAHFWMRNSYLAATGLAASFWFFVHSFPRQKKKTFYNNTAFLIITTVLIAFFLNSTFISKEVIELGPNIRTVVVDIFGYYFFASYFFLFFFGALVLLWFSYQKEEGILKIHSKILIYSILFSGSFGIFFNLILPSPFFQNFRHIHLGPLFSFFIVLALAYGIARYRIMNIRVLLVEFFVTVLILIQVMQIVFFRTAINYLISIGVLFAVLIIGFLLLRSVKKEIKRKEEVLHLAESLEKANSKLKDLDKQKTEFLSIASHQLRTPLSVIKGYTELMKDGLFGEQTEKSKEILEKINSSNNRLVKLIDDFLGVARLEQGKTIYNFAFCNINELIESVVGELREKANNKKLTIVWQPSLIERNVYIDGEKIRQVLLNFVDNAIKYSDKGRIRIIVKEEKERIFVRVKDNGYGFDKDEKDKLFQKFYRCQNIQKKNISGSGLGIYVCKKFIERHEGRVWGKSEGVNMGSEFGFWVPTKN